MYLSTQNTSWWDGLRTLTNTAKQPKAAWAGSKEQQRIYDVTVFHVKIETVGKV